jgi:steroid delta-isomerase-like uncharacterized protein
MCVDVQRLKAIAKTISTEEGMLKHKRSLYIIILVLSLIHITCSAPAEKTATCEKDSEKITCAQAQAITGQVLKIWNDGDLAITDELYTSDYIRHHPVPSANASMDDFKNTVLSNRDAFPDYNLAFDEIIIKDDKLIIRATMTGTNTTPIGERPASGKKVLMNGIYIFRISEDKIAEEWTFFNLLHYYQQLGYSITPPQMQ